MCKSVADSTPQQKSFPIAFLAPQGFNEAEVARSVRALETAGILVDVVRSVPPLDRISPAEYSALAIPALPEQAGVNGTNEAVLRLVQAMEAAGKPILYIPTPAPIAQDRPSAAGPARSFGLTKLWGESWQHWNAIDAPRLGAALAYYTLLSLAPLLVLVVSVAGVFFRRALIQSGLLWQVRSLTGNVGESIVRPVLESSRSTTGIIAGVIGILTLLLGASGVFLELRDSLDLVWGVKPPYGSGLWSLVKERLFAFLLVLGTGVMLSASILVSAILATPVRFFYGSCRNREPWRQVCRRSSR